MSSLGGKTVAKLSAHIPPSGAWWATVVLAEGSAAPALGPTTLAIGDLSLVGAVIRAGLDAPSSPRAVVVGGPGWWAPLARGESWQSDGGVKLSTVLQALSKATGETLTLPADARPFTAYGWPTAGPYAPSTGAMVLGDLVRRGVVPAWRVLPAGGTECTAWPSAGAADRGGRVLRRALDVGLREVGLDTRAAAFLPGATIEGVTIKRTVFRETAGELRAEAWES